MTSLVADTRSGTAEQDLVDRVASMNVGVGVRRIDEPKDMQRWVNQHFSSVRRELCSVLPSGPYPMDVLRSSWELDTELVSRGVNAMAIYQSDSVRTPAMLKYITDLACAGAHIRVAPRTDHRLIIFDRRVVMVAANPGTLALPYLMVSEPALVQSFCLQFATGWRVAHSVGVQTEDTLDVERVREIVQLLASGVTDERAARELGVSDRTIRRRVAAVLDLLGASSRFEAGVKAVEAGWL